MAVGLICNASFAIPTDAGILQSRQKAGRQAGAPQVQAPVGDCKYKLRNSY